MSTRFGARPRPRLRWRAMVRGGLRRAGAALVLACFALGCATGWPARYRAAHPGVKPADARPGGPATETLAGLDLPEVHGISIELRELQVMRTDVDPWQAIPPEKMDAVAGVSVAAADRVCGVREGIGWRKVERVSWFVADHGRLVAFDSARFGAGCSVTHRYHPARAPYRDTEQALLRWADLRYPDAAPPLEERLAMGPALVQAGRIDEARKLVQRAAREADRIESDVRSEVPRSDAERRRLVQREQALRDAARALDRSILGASTGRR